MPMITFIDKQGKKISYEEPAGLSLLEISRKHNMDVEGTCEGSLACSTCHMIIHPDWFHKLQEASEEEEDMLDLAFGLTETSRLGCQIIFSEKLDGLIVSLPCEQ